MTFAYLVIIIALSLVSLGAAQNETTIIVGPIIGKVTNSTARVLFEFNVNTTITVTLTDPAGTQFNTTRNVTGWVAIPFAFQGLQPMTRYIVTVNSSVTNMTESYFVTLGGPTGNLNFGVISCMDRSFQATKTPNADLWANMLSRARIGELQYLIHTGDQIYTDNMLGEPNAAKPYYACSQIFNVTARDQWDSRRGECLEMIRNEYRATWQIPTIRETLAKVPSLMIFDDHEIRDDWGYLTQDTDPNSQDYYYGEIARQAYYEYQRQLREDIDFGNYSNMTAEYYYETLNGIAFFFIDYRGIRTWNRNFSQMNGMQLGINQTQLLEQCLEPTSGIFAEAKSFFLVSPLTVVYLVEALVKIGYFSINDAQESWSYAYLDEQEHLLNLLKDWKLGRDGREVTILDGDVHMGGYTNIEYGREVSFVQFTSSSMASSAPSDAVFLGFDIVKELQTLVGRWQYEHHDWTNEYNYGIVVAKTDEDNQADVQCFLVQATDTEDPEMINSRGSNVDQSDWADILAGD